MTLEKMDSKLYAGVDIGASRTKVAILNGDKELIGHSVRKSGTDFGKTADMGLADSLKMAGAARKDVAGCVSTGYGRNNVSFSSETKTEIGCHAKGCYHYFPMAMTIIDIGGQDNKVIKVDDKGRRINFKMNRKCAAGTGAFLSSQARRLGLEIEQLGDLALKSERPARIAGNKRRP